MRVITHAKSITPPLATALFYSQRMRNWDALVKYFHYELGWEVEGDRIVAGNLCVYYRKSYEEYRLRDNTISKDMDLTSIKFPLDDNEKSRVWGICSYYFKDKPILKQFTQTKE